MSYTAKDFSTFSEVLRSITTLCGDREYNKGFTEGWFKARINDALDKLSVMTFYNEAIFDGTFPRDTKKVEVPKGCFNPMELYLFNESKCNIDTSVPVWWARDYRQGSGGGYTRKYKDNGDGRNDPFYPSGTRSSPSYYASHYNGILQFSDDCASFTNYRLVYNSLTGKRGEIPVIPEIYKEAIVLWVVDRYMVSVMTEPDKGPHYITKWRIIRKDRDDEWSEAELHAKMMSRFERTAMAEYYTASYAFN